MDWEKRRYLFKLLKRYSPWYIPGVALIVLNLNLSLSIPHLIEDCFNIMQNAADEWKSLVYGKIIIIMGLALAVAVTRCTSRMMFFYPSRKAEYYLKNEMLTHLLTQNRTYFKNNPSGSLISRINNDINGIRMLMGFGILQLTNNLMLFPMVIYNMAKVSVPITWYIIIPLGILLAMFQIVVRKIRTLHLQHMEGLQVLSDYTVETYTGLAEIKGNRAFKVAESIFNQLSNNLYELLIKMGRFRAIFMPILMQSVNILKVVLLFVGGVMIINEDLTIGGFMALTLYLSMLAPPMMGLSFMMIVLQRGGNSIKSVLEVLNSTENAQRLRATERLELPLREGLEVKNLSFAYADEPQTKVLDNVSFKLPMGQVLGIFGEIGSGKTTLINLLNGYLPAPEGSIYLEGKDISVLDLHQLRQAITTVTQDVFLFSASVSSNIGIGDVNGNAEVIKRVADQAALTKDIRSFADGLETIVGERGINLSGGQKQRIALARALLTEHEILILDDTLSAVDHTTEHKLISTLYSLNKTMVIISHRISALRKAQQIIVLKQGRITACGTHSELLKIDPYYAGAAQIQEA